MKLLASLVAIGALGCVAQPEDRLSSDTAITFEELRAGVPRDLDGAYVVEGDIRIWGDEELRRYWEARQAGSALTVSNHGNDDIWNSFDRFNLSYCVSNQFETDMAGRKKIVVDAMKEAGENRWSKFANVHFKYKPEHDANCTSGNTAVKFNVVPVSGQPYLASAFFPNYPRVQRTLNIDASSFDFEEWPFENVLSHELGHALGFRHEHIWAAPAPNCTETSTDARMVTAYDSASVMHYPQCNGTSTDLAFTQIDKDGVELLYGAPSNVNPSPMVAINAPTNGATVRPKFDVMTSVFDDELVKVEMYLDGALIETKQAPALYDFKLADQPDGPHEIEVRGYDANGQITSARIAITVESPAPIVPPAPPKDEGGCSAGGGAGGGLGLLFAALGWVGRSRRRSRVAA